MTGRTRARATTTSALDREPDEGPGRQSARLVRRDEGEPHQHDGEHGAEHSQARSHPAARAGPACDTAGAVLPPAAAATRLGEACRWRQSHHTSRPNDSASRASATTSAACVNGRRQHVGSSDRQHDALDRRDDLAPVARRQRVTQPRQQPPGDQEERSAPRRSRAPTRPTDGGDVHAEHEDQERVDLHVEAGAERRRRPGAPRHPAVDRVEDESATVTTSGIAAVRPLRPRRTSPRSAPPPRRRAWPGRGSPSRPDPVARRGTGRGHATVRRSSAAAGDAHRPSPRR